MAAAHHRSFIHRCFRDRSGRLVLYQRPNLPIVVWAVAAVLAWLLHGRAAHVFHLISLGALLVWALLELFAGVNYFRRALGLAVLVGLLLRLL